MTPKEKAAQLVKLFRDSSPTDDYDFEAKGAKDYDFNARKSAIIAVDEILNTLMKIKFYSELNFLQERRYWQEVKNEINLT